MQAERASAGPSERPTGVSPIVVTAWMERRAFERFEALRRRYFPPERNLVQAHLTLFHHLPPGEEQAIRSRLRLVARGTEPPEARVEGLVSLGRGVAFRLESPALVAVREELADAWWPLLTPQDRAPFRPHVTVQNKVSPEAARATLADLAADFRPWRFAVLGFELWSYLGGPWAPLGRVDFAGR